MQNPDIKQNETRRFGGFWLRLLAYMIDLFVVGLVIWLAGYTIEGMGQLSARSIWRRDLIFTYSPADFCQVLFCCAYFTVMTFLTGATIGKTLLHLKVVSQNGEKLKMLQVLYRETIGRYISSFLFIGYIIAGTDSRKRGFHDMLSDTYVIQTDRIPVKKKASYSRPKSTAPYPVPKSTAPYPVPQGPAPYPAPYPMPQGPMPYPPYQQAAPWPQYGMPPRYQGQNPPVQMSPGSAYAQPEVYQLGQNMYGGAKGPAGSGQPRPPYTGRQEAASVGEEQKEKEGKHHESQGL